MCPRNSHETTLYAIWVQPWSFGGNGDYAYWYGNPRRLMQGLQEYRTNPAGGGPYKGKEWEPGNRMVLERWEEIWVENPHWHKPPAKTIEM